MNEFEKQLASQPLKSIPAEWRAQILKEARAHTPASSSPPFWWLRELFWPCPQAWGALAAVWMVIAAFRFLTPGTVPLNSGELAKGHGLSITEQRRELARLLDGPSDKNVPPAADRPRGARRVDYSFA